jgi:hypothetical protein
MEAYVVKVTEADFGVPPYLYIEIEGKRAGLPPWLNAKVGDVISIKRSVTNDIERLDSPLRGWSAGDGS